MGTGADERKISEKVMRLLYLNTTYAGGGAEKVTRQIYEGMKKRGHEVYEIVCYNRRGEVEDPQVMVLYRTPLQKIWQRFQTHNRNNESVTIPYAVHKICQFIKKYKIEIVHLNNPHDSFLGMKDIQTISRMCPTVWTLHDLWALTGHCAFPVGCEEERWKTGCQTCECLDNYPRLRRDVSADLYEKKKKYFTGNKIVFTVPSQWMMEQVKVSYLKNECCSVIENSLDTMQWQAFDKKVLRQEYGIATPKMVLAFVAADISVPQKGMKLLGEVLKQLKPEKYLLLIAGKCGETLENLTKTYETRYLGYISDQRKMNEFYALADILVNPSVYETFGLVNIEAMASGTPVVAFDVCAMREIIGSDAGWCLAEKTAEALEEKLKELEADRGELQKKAQRCRQRVISCFEENKMLDEYETLYGKMRGQ